MSDVRENLRQLKERIAQAAERSGRTLESVALVAVTKTVPLEKVMPLLPGGIFHIGENRVQEALEKYARVAPHPAYHLIGQLQTNKVKKAVGFFNVIQSLDRLELAQAINRHAESIGKRQVCLIELKISSESSKSGLPPEELDPFLAQLKNLSHIEVKGLMGIAPYEKDPEVVRPYFRRLKGLFDRYAAFETLSMGMSSDFEVAIEEGSTMVRVGTALFGERP